MARYNFFERMEREINFQFEYEKIEDIVLNETNGYHTLEDEISENFRRWRFRKNFDSFLELREHLGFRIKEIVRGHTIVWKAMGEVKTVDAFILYCEMITNMIFGVIDPSLQFSYRQCINAVWSLIDYDLEQINHYIYRTEDGMYLVVQKDAAVSAVADIVAPELADGVDYIFHAAALKQVPSCEFFPMEAVRTNVIGTDNVLTAAIEAGVESVICLSTDKAAYPINAMGITKAIEEKVAVAKSRMSGKTKICCTRYGNVMCSRGSVIPLWIDQIRNGNPITLTEPSMTRFIMSLEEAVDLVLFAFEHGENGDLLIQKAPACTIQTQAEAVCELFGGKKEEIKVIGIRHGEKMYETLLTNEECAKAVDMGNFYRVPADNRGLNYDKYFKEGDEKRNTLTEFNSNNTRRLNLEETKEKIASLAYIQEELTKM